MESVLKVSESADTIANGRPSPDTGTRRDASRGTDLALPGRVPAEDFPDAPPQKIVPGSLVFTPPAGEVSFEDPLGWWRYVLPSVRTHRVIPSLRGVEWPLRP